MRPSKQVVALLSCLAASAAQAAGEPTVQVFDVEVGATVDAQGAVTKVASPETLPQAIRGAVDGKVMGLHFEPPAGKSVRTQVRLQACAEKTAAGYELSLAYRQHGPRLVLPPPLAMPGEAMANGAEPGAKAAFDLGVELGADGKAQAGELKGHADNEVYHIDYLFRKAAVRWPKAARFQPEVVDGQAHASHANLVLRFGAPPEAQAPTPAHCADALATDHPNPAIVYADSALKLRR